MAGYSCLAATAASASSSWLYPPPHPQNSNTIINNNSKLLFLAAQHHQHGVGRVRVGSKLDFPFVAPNYSSSSSSRIGTGIDNNNCFNIQKNLPCLLRVPLLLNNNNENYNKSRCLSGIPSSYSKSKKHHSQSQPRSRAALVNLRSNRRRSPAMADPLTNGAGSSPLTTTNHLRHVESMASLPSGAGNISRLNAVILGEALASEEDDLIVPSPDFSAQAHVSSPEKVLFHPFVISTTFSFLPLWH